VSSLPRISIVTPSFNQGEYLAETIQSVLGQRYPKLEYIVLDGASTDNSLRVLEECSAHLTHWESTPDRGQVHAINKGLARATGEVVAFLNSDDVYLPGALAAVGAWFAASPRRSWVCGDALLFGDGYETEHVRSRVPSTLGHLLAWAYRAPQPAMFWRRDLVASGFDERWRYCFDHELYLRLMLQGERCEHLPLPVAGYRLHGRSKTVGESEAFDKEFDLIAEQYEPRVPMRARRWSWATRLVRQSCFASGDGQPRLAARRLLQALGVYPLIAAHRPFWGCARRVLRSRRAARSTCGQ